jgi:hypothetical protein
MELRRRSCINNRYDVPVAVANGAVIPGIFRNLAGSVLHEHTMEFPQDPITVVKSSERDPLSNLRVPCFTEIWWAVNNKE